jgi:hypothetical protein
VPLFETAGQNFDEKSLQNTNARACFIFQPIGHKQLINLFRDVKKAAEKCVEKFPSEG